MSNTSKPEQFHQPASKPDMVNGWIRQIRQESAGWKRLLSFIMEENVQLKSLLPDILGERHDTLFLIGIEQFQDRFINEDHLISLLRNDLAAFEKLLLHAETGSGKFKESISRKLEILRNNLYTAELQFSELRSSFFRFLLEKP